jgi:hypothetical protein
LRSARRWNAAYQHFAKLAPGQDTLCRQAASLCVQRERLDQDLANGADIDPDILVRVSGALARTLERLGLTKEPSRIDRLIEEAKREARA